RRGLQLGHKCSPTDVADDLALPLQALESLAQRVAGDAQLGLQLTFRRQAMAGFPQAQADITLDALASRFDRIVSSAPDIQFSGHNVIHLNTNKYRMTR